MRVQLVCEEGIVSEGLCRILAEMAGEVDFLGVAAPTREGLGGLVELRPQFVVVALPDTPSTLHALQQIARRIPDCRRIVYADDLAPDTVTRLLAAGARGLLHPREDASELRRVLETVATGRTGLSTVVRRALGEPFLRIPEENDPVKGKLTPREREILARLADGQTSKEIAHELGISSKTVDTHRRNVQRKLGASGLADLVKHAIRSGLTTLDL